MDIMTLSIAIVIAAFCIVWTLCHVPQEADLGTTDDNKAKLREHLVLDIRANSQYCRWTVGLIGVIATIVAANRTDFKAILNPEHLWPFGLSFLIANIALVFFPAGYGTSRFSTLRTVWVRSVVCEQIAVIFTCYGILEAFRTATGL